MVSMWHPCQAPKERTKTMADVKWVKISTGFLGNRKIKQIRRLPEGDTIALMWVFLMCLAGEINNNGMVYFTPEIPYTDEMLAEEFKIDIGIVRVALQTFQQFGMIEIDEGIICISSWEKWQSTDKLEKIREQTRKRVSKHREKQKKLVSSVTVTQDVTQCNATDKNREEKEKKEKRIEEEGEKNIVRNTYGEFDNVLLSADEYVNLIKEFPSDYNDRIDSLSSYMESSGKTYDNHYATIKFWDKKDKEKKDQTAPSQQHCSNPFLAMAMKEKGV